MMIRYIQFLEQKMLQVKIYNLFNYFHYCSDYIICAILWLSTHLTFFLYKITSYLTSAKPMPTPAGGPLWNWPFPLVPSPPGGGEGTNYKTNHKNFHKKRGISNKPPYTNFILYKKVLKKLHILYINR